MTSEQEKARLLHLYESALRAHLEHDARTFLAEYASQWYEVRNAGVRLRTKEEAFPAIERYFSFRCAWVSIYEKQEGQWAQVVDAPSFQFQTNDDESSRATG